MHSTQADPITSILERLESVKQTANGWQAKCPGHDDHKASLCISTGADGRVLVKCQAGCDFNNITAALGMKAADFFTTKPQTKSRIVAAYDYIDADGVLRYQCVRKEPKDFCQRRPDGNGGWVWNLQGVERVLYRLPELLNHRDIDPDRWVFIPEGEKDVDRLTSLGLTATCNVGGAGKWQDTYSADLAGLKAAVIGDNDDAGRKHAAAVATSLLGKAKEVRIVELPGLPPKGDVSDFLDAGGTVEQLMELVEVSPTFNLPQKSAESPETDKGDDVTFLPGPILKCLADIDAKPIDWLWPQRIALGTITLFVGRPGEGKSTASLDFIARVTTASPWPDGSGNAPLGSALIISAEDDAARMLRPRADAARADVQRIHLLSTVRKMGEHGKPLEVMFSLEDVPAMEAALQQIGDCKLVVIDPIGSFIGGGTDAHRDNEVRGVLAPVAMLAEKYGVAVLIVAHRRKSAGNVADDLALGSRAFTGIARACWHLSRDPDDKRRRLFLPGKNNLAPEGHGLAFTIEGNPPAICWEHEAVQMDADDGLAAENGEHEKPGPEPKAREAAVDWLATLLTDGEVAVAKIKQDAKEAGLSWRTVQRAADTLSVIREKNSFNAGWQWRFPKPSAERAKMGVTLGI